MQGRTDECRQVVLDADPRPSPSGSILPPRPRHDGGGGRYHQRRPQNHAIARQGDRLWPRERYQGRLRVPDEQL